MQSPFAFLLFFGNKKNSKSSIFFHSLILIPVICLAMIQFEEKKETKAIISVPM